MTVPEPSIVAGRYVLLERLGVGGMGEVWLASDRNLDGKKVAVKRLSGFVHELTSDDPEVRSARREAFAASRLDHPNIVTVTDFVVENGQPLIVMEYIAGQSLEQQCADGPLPLAVVVDVMSQVAGALAAAHEVGIVHRDVKPANIMLSHRGIPKLTDFGIARSADETRFTATGSTRGTMRYMAPELFEGADSSPASDVWALGATMFEIAEGRPAFDGTNQAVLVTQIVFGPPPTPQRCPQLAPLLEAMLARSPGDRPSAEEARLALLNLRSVAPSDHSDDSPGEDDREDDRPEREDERPDTEIAPRPGTTIVLGTEPPPARPAAGMRRRGRVGAALAIVAVVVVAAVVVFIVSQHPGSGSHGASALVSISADHPMSVAASPDGQRVYFTDSGGVEVVNTATNARVASVGVDGNLAFGIAVSPDGADAYVATRTQAGAGSLMEIATASDTVVAKIPVGDSANGVAVTPDGKDVYVTNFGGTVSVVDTSAKSVVHTIPVYPSAEHVAVSANGKYLYVDTEQGVMVIDAHSYSVLDTDGDLPINVVGFAVLPNAVYVADSGGVQMFDNNTGKVTASFGNLQTSGIALSSGSNNLYITDPTGLVKVLDATTGAVIKTIDGVKPEPGQLALAANGHRLYVACGNVIDSGAVKVIDV